MNVGIVTHWFESGAGFVSKAYADTFMFEHKVYIFARGGRQPEKNSIFRNYNVTWASYHPCLTGIHQSEFLNWVRQNNIEVVLFNEQRHWDIVIYAKSLGILIGSYIDYYTQETVQFFKLYDFVICNTKRHYSVFNDHPQVTFCKWGTDVSNLNKIYKKRKKTNKFTFLISAGWDGVNARYSNFLDRRGTGSCVDLFANNKLNATLKIYSQVELSSCPINWQRSIKNSLSNIEFIVGTFGREEIYANGNFYLYPSRLDGIGLTLPEALSTGMPAFTTDSAPMNEFVIDSFNGYLIKVSKHLGRPDGYYWAESIIDETDFNEKLKFIINNPNLYEELSFNAFEYSTSNLNWTENSHYLNSWIKSINIINKDLNNDLNNDDLIKKAKYYDYINNPTPLQYLQTSTLEFLVEIKKLVRENLNWIYK